MAKDRPMQRCARLGATLGILVLGLAAACGSSDGSSAAFPSPPSAATAEAGQASSLRLYTTVTQDTVDAVVAGFTTTAPGVEVEVFRAPTAELNARVAAERREGVIQADVLWLTDPLSMQQFANDGLLRRWTPANADAVPDRYRTEAAWGTRLLNLVIVHRPDLDPAPGSWTELADPAYADAVAIPDPGFAGSAFAALGYFALAPDFGMDYYRRLAGNGAVQVQAPGEVVTGVAEARFAAGMTLDNPARSAAEAGSPLVVVRPEPGAIAVYSPIAVLEDAQAPEAAEGFVDHVLSVEGQQAIASTGWQPIRPDVDWPHATEPSIAPDWASVFQRQDDLLEEYRAIFGG